MAVKVKTKKEKVLRTHACVVDIYKATTKSTCYFKSFVPSKEIAQDAESKSDSSSDEKFRAYCPRCSSFLYDSKDSEELRHVQSLSCKTCDIDYSETGYKFAGDPEGRCDNHKKRITQWTEKVEIFLSNGEILHVRPYITSSYIFYSKKNNEYVVARNTHIYKLAFNLRTGLSYDLGVVDGKGRTYSTVLDHDSMYFRRNRGNFPRLLRTQANNTGAFWGVFPEISFIIKDIIKSSQFAFDLEKLEKVESFGELSLWNRLKKVNSQSRATFYKAFISFFPVGYKEEKFLEANGTHIAKLINKEKNNSFENYVDNISFQTKSGKALKKIFYKNPMNLRYNQQLYRLGLKDVNHRLTLLNTLGKLTLFTVEKQNNVESEIFEFNSSYYEVFDFFLNILEFSGEQKLLSLIKQLNEMLKGFEILYNIQIGNLTKLTTPINCETFVQGSFKISNYKGTPMLKKYDDFKETRLLYYRLCDSISDLNEQDKQDFQKAIYSSFEGKNFHEIHENLSGITSAINNLKLQTPITYTDDDRRFEGVFGDYEFFLPEKVIDFTEFGRKFSNCVGSYVNSVMKRESLIVIARDAKTKDLKLCIELSGTHNKYTDGDVRSSLQYKSFYNRSPKKEDLPSLMAWYESLGINNARCFDTYWLKDKSEKPINNENAPLPIAIQGNYVNIRNNNQMDFEDEDLPF